MKYAQHRSTRSRGSSGSGKKPLLWIGLFALIILGVGLVLIFRSGGEDSSVDVAVETTNDSNSGVVNTADGGLSSGDLQSIDLDSLVGAQYGGTARRGIEGETFTHVVVADLPGIELSTHFYEGWLVKPGVTEFFSTGELFPRADGKWGLVWESVLSEAPTDIEDFTRVVITKEIRDDDPAPSVEHVLEGSF